MSTTDRSFMGAGSIHIQPYDLSAPLLPIGNISEFNFSFEEDRKELKNYLGGGGNRNVISRVSSITANLVAHDFTSQNIALALRGSISASNPSAITGEEHPSHGVEGELIPLKYLPDTSKTITVTDGNDLSLNQGEDYELTSSGVKVIGKGNISSVGIKVSYTPAGSSMVQVLIESGREFVLFMEGLNDAQEGLPFNIRVHRVKFSPVQNLGFISDDFASIPLQLDVLADTRITSNGLSAFMQIDLAQ